MAVFPALSHLSSQLLVTAVRPDVVCAMARWQESERSVAWRDREGAVRVACLCGSCSWHIPRAWLAQQEERLASRIEQQKDRKPAPDEDRYKVTCSCSAQSPASRHCPNRGNCESNLRWLRARFGVCAQHMSFLWMPQSDAADFSDNDSNGVLTRGIQFMAEPVA